MRWAINDATIHTATGIHSPKYAKAVYERLKRGFDGAGRTGVVKALTEMARALQRDERFWLTK